MSHPTSRPLEAIPLPDSKPRRTWVPVIMGGMLLGSGILAVVLMFWGLIRLVEQNRPGSMTFTGDAGNWQTRDEKQAEYRAIYKVPPDVPVDADLHQVDKLLTKYVSAVQYGDQGGLARIVDVNAFLARMQEHPDMPRLDASSRRALLDMLNRELQLPGSISECRLMGFKRIGKAGAAVADVMLKTTSGSSDPCRLWLRQDHRSWSVVDWEMVEQGKSEAAKWASSQRAGQDWVASYPHQSFLDELIKADNCYSTGDVRGAVSALTAADPGQLPSYVQPELQLAVALRFYSYGEFQHAIDTLRTIQTPQEVPSVYSISAACYQALGDADKAAEAAREYERLCGFAPDVVRAKAWALAQLDKKEEATAELKRLLEFDPTDQLALQQLLQILPAGQKGQIAELISRAKDPPKTALSIVNNYQIRDDEETAHAIKDLLEAKFKDSPDTHAFVGQVHQHEEEHDEAAAAFRRAHDAEMDPAQKTHRWHTYVEAMLSAGKLLEAYEQSPDPIEIFSHLTSGLDDEESLVATKDLPSLLEAHRRRAPQDPQIWICAGHLARDQGDLPAAEATYAEGEAKTQDEDLKARLQFARMTVLADQGKILDAYRQYEALPDSFQFLANQSRFQHKPDVLEALLRSRKVSHPDDEDLEYYQAVLEIERGQFPQALQRLLSSREPKDDEDEENVESDLALRMRWLRLDVYEKHDQWQKVLQQDPEFDELWPQLAQRFWQQQKWQKLRELLDLPIPRSDGGAQRILYEMRLAWNLGRYDQFESLVDRWNADEWDAIPTYEQKWARETLVRALIRQGRVSAAFSYAEQFQRESQDELPLLLVRIAQGDVPQVKEIYSRIRHQIYNLSQDAELFPLLADSRFAEIRREHPFPLPGENARVSIVLFLREPLTLDEEKLAALCQDIGAPRIASLSAAEKSRQTYLVTHEQGTISLTTGSNPYFPSDTGNDVLRELKDSTVKSEISAHQAWLAMDLRNSSPPTSQPQEDLLARQLLRKLLNENVLALGVVENNGLMTLASRSAVHLPEPGIAQSWPDLVEGGPEVWWGYRASEADEHSPPLSKRQFREFVAALAKLPAGELAQIKVRLKSGHAEEDIWLKVIGVQREEYGVTFTAEIQKPSKIWPYLQPGESCSVSAWQVRETKLP